MNKNIKNLTLMLFFLFVCLNSFAQARKTQSQTSIESGGNKKCSSKLKRTEAPKVVSVSFCKNKDSIQKDTYTNLHEVEKKVDETFSLIASKFKLGIEEAKNAKQEIEKTQEEVNKQIKGYE